jgi:hypothetical protein
MLLIFMAIAVFFISINGHENGEPYTQSEWVQLAAAALLLLCGTAIALRRGDN